MPKPLFDRIAADLKPSARLADCRRDLTEAERELSEVAQRMSIADECAVDPSVGEEAARDARQQVEDLRFYRRRLERAIEELKHSITAKEADESYRDRRDAFERAKAVRDELVERWRGFGVAYGHLQDLIVETIANDRLLEQVNAQRPSGADRLESSEIVARGALNDSYWPNSIGQNGEPFVRFTLLDLPHFEPGRLSPSDDHRKALVSSVEQGLRAAAEARTPQALDAAAKREADRWTRYEVSQCPYRGHLVGDVAHRGGVAGIGNKPVLLWLHEGQAADARRKGLSLKQAPVEVPLQEA